MKVGAIGHPVTGLSIENISFLSKKNLLDFDVLFIDMGALSRELYDEFKYIPAGNIERLKAVCDDLKARTSNVKNFFAHGGLTFVVMNTEPSYLEALMGQKLIELREEKFNLLDILSLDSAEFDVEEILGDQFLDLGVLNELSTIFRFNYKFRFNKHIGKKVLVTRKGNDVVGVEVPVEKGSCYLLPQFGIGKDIKDVPSRDYLFRIIKMLLPKSLPLPDDQESYPIWAKDYIIYDEMQTLAERQKLLAKLDDLKSQIVKKEQRLDEYLELKRLVFEGDQHLELAVQRAFETLGYGVIVPEGNKDDLKILEDEFKAVIEVKGLTKSGSTLNAMQLDKWVTNYALDNGAELPKGILIVNPFKKLAPSLRTEIVFPKDMLDYSLARKHCLMRTEDLLSILIDFKANLITKSEITDLLKDTVGILLYKPRYK
jgi:hypothetical protein